MATKALLDRTDAAMQTLRTLAGDLDPLLDHPNGGTSTVLVCTGALGEALRQLGLVRAELAAHQEAPADAQ